MMKFKTILNTAAMAYIFVTVNSLCDALSKVLQAPLINSRHTVKIKIDNGDYEALYCCPKIKLIMSVE